MLANLPQSLDAASSAERLQRRVERLALQLARAVLVDDPELRPIAYSPQDVGSIDRVRALSILRREVPPEVGTYFQNQRISSAYRSVRVRGKTTMGLRARACAPIRHDDRLLGFVWVIEGKQPLTRAELTDMENAAQEIGELLGAPAEPREEIRLRTAITGLLSPDPSTSSGAAADIFVAGVVSSTAHAAVLVAELVPPDGEAVGDAMTVLVSRALQNVRDTGAARVPLVLAKRDHAVVISADEDRQRLLSGLSPIAETLQCGLREVLPDGWRVTVGISDLTPSLLGVPQVYDHARRAAIVAARIPQMTSVLRWADIGIYGLLTPLLEGDPQRNELPPALTRLLAERRADIFLKTLEVYLDNGGDVQATAAELSLARGSLYYRLNRIAVITHADLRSGQDRLMLHVGLKLARLSGRY